MKKLCILAALLLALIPGSAMAGMSAASDMDLQEVSGQTGITLSMTMNVSATGFAWGDGDGFAGHTTEGWVVLSGVTLPTIAVNNLQIDAGANANTAFVAITTSGNLITGGLTIARVVIGSTTSQTQGGNVGEVRVTGIGIGFGTILVSGH